MYGQVTDMPTGIASPTDSITTTNLILYVVFAIAFLVFIAVVAIIIKLFKRKTANPNGYTLTSTGKIAAC